MMLTSKTPINRFNPNEMIKQISSDISKGITPKKVFLTKNKNKNLRQGVKKKEKGKRITINDSKVSSRNHSYICPSSTISCTQTTKHYRQKRETKLKLNLLFSHIIFNNTFIKQTMRRALSAERTNHNNISFELLNQTNDDYVKQMRFSQLKTSYCNSSFDESNSYNDYVNNIKITESQIGKDKLMHLQKKVTFCLSPIKLNKSFSYNGNHSPDAIITRPMSIISKLRNKPIMNFNRCYCKRTSAIEGITHIGQYKDLANNINQDAFCINNSFLSDYESKDSYCAVVCDGHGVNGHIVSNYIANRLSNELRYQIVKQPCSLTLIDNIERNRAISTAYKELNDKLSQTGTDITLSGCSCCCLITTPQSVICSNIGNCRAVMGSFKENKWFAYDLSRDHTPNVLSEHKRITSNGGSIKVSINDKSSRVVMKEEDIPGVKTTRSFGDSIGASIGIIAVPEIKEYRLSLYDKYFIIASDGVWEVISSQECIEMISEFYMVNNIKGANKYLYQVAYDRWVKRNDNNNSIDDITFVLSFFE